MASGSGKYQYVNANRTTGAKGRRKSYNKLGSKQKLQSAEEAGTPF